MHGSTGGRWQRGKTSRGAAGPRSAAGKCRHDGLVGTSTVTTVPSEPVPYLTVWILSGVAASGCWCVEIGEAVNPEKCAKSVRCETF